MFEIYLITNQINEVQYVGQCIQGLKKRLGRHINDAKAGSELHLHRAMRKYGYGKFTISLLATAKDQIDLDRLEMLWIKILGTKAPGGYNLTEGGGGVQGNIQSAETRAKKSRVMKGKNIGKQVGEKSWRFKHELDTKKMIEMYYGGKSVPQIAKLLNARIPTVRSRLKTAGVKFRSNSEAQKLWNTENIPSNFLTDISTKDIVNLFGQGLTHQAIADQLGISKRGAVSRLLKLGITRPPHRCNVDKDAVVALYLTWGSLRGIAKEFGISVGTVDLILKEKNIPRTNRGKRNLKPPIAVREVEQVSSLGAFGIQDHVAFPPGSPLSLPSSNISSEP